MEYRRVGNSGLRVSEIGLGGYEFGGRVDEATSLEIINHAVDMGINFMDTAAAYADGRSEEFLGKALKGNRSDVIIATKFGAASQARPDRQSGSRIHIMESLDASLKRLNTDWVDLYFVHRPDAETPIQETLRTLDDLVRTGKVRYIGCSNFASWQLCEASWTSQLSNLETFVASESRYNMLDRRIEHELVPCCKAYGVGVIPWKPLAGGFLTGRYHRGQQIPAGTRLASRLSPDYKDIPTPANFDKLAKLEDFADERDRSVGDLAIAWLLSHSWVGSVIAGVTSVEQLSLNMGATGWDLSAEDIATLNGIL